MNETRDTKGIEQIYGLIVENEDNRVWKTGDCPEALGDSPLAHDHAEGSGALGDHDAGDVESGFGSTLTPEDAGEDNQYYLNKISERLKEKEKKSGKKVNEQINNSVTMSDKPDNIFDKLYSTIMEGDDPFADLEPDLPGGDEDLGGEDELDIGGDEVTLSLPRDLAEKLHEVLMAQLEGGEEEGDDFGDESSEDDFDEMLGDAVVSEPAPKPLGGHGDRQHKDAGNTGSGSNKISSSKTGSSDGGNADGSASGADESPKPLGGHGDRQHKDAGNTGSGSNKVKNTSKAIGD